MMYDSLVRINAQGQITPDIASHWQIEDDSQLYIFHLNTHAKWWNGRPISAKDVAWTYTLYANPHAPTSPGQSLADLVSAVNADGPDTVAFHLTKPDPGFLADVAAAGDGHWILPAYLVDRIPVASLPLSPVFNRIPDMMGSGPYRPVSHVAGGIRWIANPHYFLGRPSTRSLLTVWSGTAHADISWATEHTHETQHYTGPSYSMLLYNNAATHALPTPLQRALPDLINRRSLADDLTGTFTPCAEPVVPGSIYAIPTVLSQGRAILIHAGYKKVAGIWTTPTGHRVHVTITTPAAGINARLGQLVAKQLTADGIPTTINAVRNISGLLHTHDFSVALIERRAAPYPTIEQDYSINGTQNYGFYMNFALQKVLKAPNQQANDVTPVREALTLLIKNPPGAFLLWTDRPVLVQPTVRHFTLNPYNPLETIRHWTVIQKHAQK